MTPEEHSRIRTVLQKARKDLDVMRKDINRARQADVDVVDQLKEFKRLQQKISRLETAFK